MSYAGEYQQQKHTQHAPSTKTECDYLYGLIKQLVTNAKVRPKIVNPRNIAGNTEKQEDEDLYLLFECLQPSLPVSQLVVSPYKI